MSLSRRLHDFEQIAPGLRVVGSFGVYVYYSPEKYVENIIIIFLTFLRDRMLNLLLRMLIANQQHICWGGFLVYNKCNFCSCFEGGGQMCHLKKINAGTQLKKVAGFRFGMAVAFYYDVYLHCYCRKPPPRKFFISR